MGTLAVPFLAWVGLKEESSWRFFVVLCSLPCLLSTILTYYWVPESPRWLLTQGRQSEALMVLRKAAITNFGMVDAQNRFPDTLILYDHQIDQEVHSLSALFQPEWRKMTFLLWSTWTGLAFLYWGTIQGTRKYFVFVCSDLFLSYGLNSILCVFYTLLCSAM